MQQLFPDTFTNWRIGKKVRPLRAKPLINLVVDRSVSSKFLVDTLEGKEPLGDGAVICIGEAGDAWQQMPAKLLAKYTVTSIDSEGWMVCEPRPDNAVEVVCVEKEDIEAEQFFVIGQWGETLEDGTKNVQRGTVGDYICRNRTDPTDVWVVRRKIFNNSYIIRD